MHWESPLWIPPEYSGTILFITHDREFLNGIAQTIIEIENSKLRVFEGDYDYYLWKKGEQLPALEQDANDAKYKTPNQQSKKHDRKRRANFLQEKQRRIGPLQKSLDALEEDVAANEEKKEALTAEICKPEVIADSGLLTAKSRELNEISKKLNNDYKRWEDLSSQIEKEIELLDDEFSS